MKVIVTTLRGLVSDVLVPIKSGSDLTSPFPFRHENALLLPSASSAPVEVGHG